MEELLRLENVSKIVRSADGEEHCISRSIDLTLNKGDFVTVIGSNGAGKSTLLNLISGGLQASSGSIFLNKQKINGMKVHQRAKAMARVFQDPQIGTCPHLTVAENLAIAEKRGKKRGLLPALSKDKKKRYSELLKKMGMGLEERLETEAGLLSGGQRQVLTLLMATMQSPELLLLDEHTAALDPHTSNQVMKLTKTVVEEQGLTTLMITHNMQDAIDYGNRLIMLHKGEIVADLDQEKKSQLTHQQLLTWFRNLSRGEAVDLEEGEAALVYA
ncbi:ATP-binding cassette domain-containing protein [Atopobacter sp. AH10]|uniref:ABC transporter ATP-binding protein n=1 Tax=Atopobacter sp. AH10 TaxID=2315861 RepID=UPI000EF20F60|nr:ATP-binding cassette domain-containing protein [Atopobacter sp. AH10]RLK64166.1 ATP-binding cassette domain-containing protein [Atopobacter sp. AH10]